MSEALALNAAPKSLTSAPRALPSLPWADLKSVPPKEIAAYIEHVEQACLANPRSADLRTCLGLAYAVNHDVYNCMDALEAATALEPDHFWAQFKYAELHYRLRALPRAESETVKAAELATTPFQLALARKQLQEIRALLLQSTRTVTWTKPLTTPALVLSAMMVVIFVVMLWK